jgi:hypothetical protein
VLAYAKIFMASAAVALNVAGVVIVGASGQRIMITLGLSTGWTKTTSTLSPDALIVPLAEGRSGMIGHCRAPFPSRPWQRR